MERSQFIKASQGFLSCRLFDSVSKAGERSERVVFELKYVARCSNTKFCAWWPCVGCFAGELRLYGAFALKRLLLSAWSALHIEMQETDPLDEDICGQIVI